MPGDGPLWQGGAEPAWTDRAAQFGDGVFETIAMQQDRGWLLDRHLVRLSRGIEALGLCWPEAEQLAMVLHNATQAAAKVAASVFKLTVSAGGARRGYGRDPHAPAVVRGMLFSAPSENAQTATPARLQLCQTHLSAQPRLAGLKHLNRLEQVLAQAELDPDRVDEGLMLDDQGCVAEGTYNNLLLARDGQLLTPALKNVGVHGVLRQALLERQAPPLATAEIALGALSEVQSMWLCNSVRGLRPVGSLLLGDRTLQFSPSAIDRSLQAAMAQLRAQETYTCHSERLRQTLEAEAVGKALLEAVQLCALRHE